MSVARSFSRRATRSQYTLPEASSTRRTPAGSTVVSGRTGSKVPEVKSSTALTAALLRSIDFGVKTISGLRGSVSACLRSRWK